MLDDDCCEALYNHYKNTYKENTSEFFSKIINNYNLNWMFPNANLFGTCTQYIEESNYNDFKMIYNDQIMSFKELCEKLDLNNDIIINFLLENV